MQPLARSILATAMVASLHACSSRMHGARDGIPARPALGAQIDRAGRPLTANALLGPLAPDDVSDRRKELIHETQSHYPAGPDDFMAQRTVRIFLPIASKERA